MRRNAYSGPAPVTLADYSNQVLAQSVADMHVTRDDVQREFRDVVASSAVLDQLGAAMNSGRALFFHGPAGSGKSYLAERLNGLLSGAIALPHAVMVDGEVLPFLDPMLHTAVARRPAVPSDPPLGARRAPRRADGRRADARHAGPAIRPGHPLVPGAAAT